MSIDRSTRMESPEEESEEWIDLVCRYFSVKTYSDKCSVSKKQQIRQRSKKFEIENACMVSCLPVAFISFIVTELFCSC